MQPPAKPGRNSLDVPRTAFIATYVPRQCGIATFTRDLVAALGTRSEGRARPRVIAMDRPADGLAYPAEVICRLDPDDRPAYRRLVRGLEADGVQLLAIQHEYGIFGGPSGAYLLDLLDATTIPVVTTLHSILARPTPTQEQILRAIAARSARLVTMAERGRSILVERYGVARERIAVIPHGVPDFSTVDPVAAKTRLGVDGCQLILTFGLLGPQKNVELVLEALARIVDHVPPATYAVVGATHPDIRRRDGERYREGLRGRAIELGLEDRVRFVDRYLDDQELATWLAASDVFVTPYRDAQQISSGTLAYALAAGSAVVSTPYEHAVELLGTDRGVLVPFDDADALATVLERLLTDESHRESIRTHGREHGRSMVWTNVAGGYAELFQAVVSGLPRSALRPAPGERARAGAAGVLSSAMRAELPVSRRHLDELRGPIGIFQFARGRVPDASHGYCTDDVARALRVDLRHGELQPGPIVAAAIRSDVAFIREAYEPGYGRFRNFRSADGRWLEWIGSEDAHGRAVQALGETVARCVDRAVAREARRVLLDALPATLSFAWARPRAYAILGCAAAHEGARVHATLLERLADSVRQARLTDSAWPWPEDPCTYDNGVIAEALIVGGNERGLPAVVESGLRVLDWLVAAETGPDGLLQPIGNRGWWTRSGRRAQWDQQPIEPASLASAAVAAWAATGDEHWRDMAERAFGWFLGANSVGLAVADPDRGACRDGLGPDGLNGNEGAESTTAWLLAVERIRELRQGRSVARRIGGRGHERTNATTSDSRAVASAMAESATP
jgi:glycosyltransferase involved in cell wall biosynthesis